MEYWAEDLAILITNTGLNNKDANLLLCESGGDVVKAILKFSGDDVVEPSTKSKIKEKTEAELKIYELRNILDKKDAMMESMLKKQKVDK